MNFYVMTLFTDMVLNGLRTSITGRAIEKGLISVEAVDIRDYAINRHGQVDDAPYGGGAGLVMQPKPICDCYEALCRRLGRRPRVLYMTPQGRVFDQSIARELAREEDLVFLCGHYEGVDERALDMIVTDHLSIGDYVLTGGELPAMVMIDCISRLVPGVLHNDASAEVESFKDNLLEYPQYTRPEEYEGLAVPQVLLTGHHKNIENWRREQSIRRTFERRPDLLEKAKLSRKDLEYLDRLRAESRRRAEKQERYGALVEEIKEYVTAMNGGEEPFPGFGQCDAASLWTYWQGRSAAADGAVLHHLDARILLVGHDWGTPRKNEARIRSIRDLNERRSRRYITDDLFSPRSGRMADAADERLRRLFKDALGYDLLRSGAEDRRSQELFFTDLYPGFHTGKTAKDMAADTAAAEGYFRRLAEIIEPEAILCLGSDVYRGVRRALGAEIGRGAVRPYSAFVDADEGTPVRMDGGRRTTVYALAHPGTRGTLNRAGESAGAGLEKGMALMEKDWRKIGERLGRG